MVPQPTADRPSESDRLISRKDTDHRKENAGRPDGLTAKLKAARDSAPDGADTIQIASVAWEAFQRQADPESIWNEVMADG